MWFWILVFLGFVILIVWQTAAERNKIAAMSPDEREAYTKSLEQAKLTAELGPINPAMICPHCRSKGVVRTKDVERKKGISGGKAAAALLTGGVTLLATGLSRKEAETRAHCTACKCTWHF